MSFSPKFLWETFCLGKTAETGWWVISKWLCSLWRSGVLRAVYTLVALLRRIKLLVLVTMVRARERSLSICCSSRYLFPILAVKHGNRGKEKRNLKASHTSCLRDSIWVLWLEFAGFILITSLGRRSRHDQPASHRLKLWLWVLWGLPARQRRSRRIQGCLNPNVKSPFSVTDRVPAWGLTLACPTYTLGEESREWLSLPSQLSLEYAPEPISPRQARDCHWQDSTEIFCSLFSQHSLI